MRDVPPALQAALLGSSSVYLRGRLDEILARRSGICPLGRSRGGDREHGRRQERRRGGRRERERNSGLSDHELLL